MGVIAKGIPTGCQGLFTPVSLGYPLSVFNKNFTLNGAKLSDFKKKLTTTGTKGNGNGSTVSTLTNYEQKYT